MDERDDCAWTIASYGCVGLRLLAGRAETCVTSQKLEIVTDMRWVGVRSGGCAKRANAEAQKNGGLRRVHHLAATGTALLASTRVRRLTPRQNRCPHGALSGAPGLHGRCGGVAEPLHRLAREDEVHGCEGAHLAGGDEAALALTEHLAHPH